VTDDLDKYCCNPPYGWCSAKRCCARQVKQSVTKAVEENSVQQLKAEISAIVDIINDSIQYSSALDLLTLVRDKLRQLSAV